MNSIFSFDNPVWNFIGKLADMVILTLLWALCSLPVVTLGASTTALYYVMLKLAEDKEGSICTSFFRAFRENLKRATLCWIIMLAIGLVLCGDLLICWQIRETTTAKVLLIVFLVLAVVYMMVLTYFFPLLARCETDVKNLFLLAFLMPFRQLGRTVLMLTVTCCVLAVGVFVQWIFLFISVGLIAYLHALIVNPVLEAMGLGLSDTADGAYEIPY